MKIKQMIVVLDAPDLRAESSFWAAMLDGEAVEDGDWHSVYADGVHRLDVQEAPNHVRPEWPSGSQQQQLHLDVYVDDRAAAHDKAISLGATLLQAAEGDATFEVYADPAGHPFCLCWG